MRGISCLVVDLLESREELCSMELVSVSNDGFMKQSKRVARFCTIKILPENKVINNMCRYQSTTQQYLKRCLIKNDNNYMFRPIAAIIRFSSESMVVVLYRFGMVMSRW